MTYAHIWTVRAPLDAYDRIMAELGPEPPDGLILHLASPTADGFRVVEVWESADHSARYAGQRLAPVVDRILHDLPPGDREILPVHRLQLGGPHPEQ